MTARRCIIYCSKVQRLQSSVAALPLDLLPVLKPWFSARAEMRLSTFSTGAARNIAATSTDFINLFDFHWKSMTYHEEFQVRYRNFLGRIKSTIYLPLPRFVSTTIWCHLDRNNKCSKIELEWLGSPKDSIKIFTIFKFVGDFSGINRWVTPLKK